jgi:hypothetical protein
MVRVKGEICCLGNIYALIEHIAYTPKEHKVCQWLMQRKT